MSAILWKLATSRLGIACIAVLIVLITLATWHRAEIRKAVAGYVAQVEISALQAELDATKEQKRVADLANQELEKETVLAQANAEKFEKDLRDYAKNNPINPACLPDAVVSDSFLDGL